jgi:hypothetical protein
MDIEFIICWEDRTWTTEVYEYKKEDLPPSFNETNGNDCSQLCTERLEKIIKEAQLSPSTFSSSPCRSPVHVGIYWFSPDE